MGNNIWTYVVDTQDWPLRYVAVIRFTNRSELRAGEYLQASCFTYRGARRWLSRMEKRAEEGMCPG